MTKSFIVGAAIAALVGSTPALAGEVSGNGKDLPLNGRSLCAYSGQNDTPDGLWVPDGQGGFIQIDPGGHVQSYGYFKAQQDFLPSPSDKDARNPFSFPGLGCNPIK
ncbi:hypothetical protein ACUXST_001919 [Sphingomonas sp. F9_3S_D5_B_2]|jgi:hypothetical protein